ncbi:MAG: hypothetical protein F7C07_03465 [Desulfurococcales archaeon]|nr:hypothetical protein [Desulfurococcales archaeon]
MDVSREKILKVISDNQPCSTEELIATLGINDKKDLVKLRRILAELVRNGILAKKPDYKRRKIVYVVKESQ